MNFFVILLLLLTGGIFGLLHRISLQEIGKTYYTLITYLFLVGLGFCLLSFRPTGTSQWGQFSLIVLGMITGFIHLFALKLDRGYLRRIAYWCSVGVILFLLGTITYKTPLPSVMEPIAPPVLLFAHLILSAAIMGSIVEAMICGHWYLVNQDLSLNPIHSISQTLTVSILFKIILVGWSLFLAENYDPLLFREIVFYLPILFWVRLLVGLGGGLFFNWMSWRALEYGNTQASTGILYACIIWIILGEFSGFYLTIRTGVPL